MRYTARYGGDAEAVRAAIKPANTRSILISAANTFGDQLYAFLHPADTEATEQLLTLPLAPALFPFSNLGTPMVTGIGFIIELATPLAKPVGAALSSANIAASFDLGGTRALAFTPAAGVAAGGAVGSPR